ncbi:MAG: response regulator, partial [Candidatus Omnitrophica bacterium]|nr:response regulator [Candidatus Omnitrophota bacterium]
PIRDENGVIIGASKIARDITQRKKVERDLKNLTVNLEKRVEERTRLLEEQTDRLRQLAVELTEAEQRERRRLAEVLHDHLQQYLVAAKMRLHLMERRLNGFVEGMQEATSYIDLAIDASRQLTAELRPPVLYEGGLSAALHFLSQKMEKQHKFRVHLFLAKDIEPNTDSVKVMIYQCVQELLFNAVKYAQASEAFVTVMRRDNQSLQILVEDTGVGFDVTTIGKKRDKGGFGLFSIRERMRALSGEFNIESTPGVGSVFTLIVPDIIPVAETEEIKLETKGSSGAEAPKTTGIVVLVADDHPIIRQSIASLLVSQEFIREVIQADNGEDAVRKAQSRHPDIILMDINMPGMNGVEATQIISGMSKASKVIGLSVQPESEMGEAMRLAGAVDYFNKGDDVNHLIESIKKFSFDRVD